MNTSSNAPGTVLRTGSRHVTLHTKVNPAHNPEKFADPSREKMRALTWQGPKDVQITDSLKPKILDDCDVIVKVTGSTICGTDLHLYHGSIPRLQKGDILGHEFCGEVDSVGPAVRNLEPGDRVVASFQIFCGECYHCKHKLSNQCELMNSDEVENLLYGHRAAGILGYSHLTGGFDGGQAEYVRMPFGNVCLLKLPDDVPDEKGLYLSDVLPTAYHCVVDTGVQEGDTVAVWGLGPLGLMAAHFAFKKGASRVIGIDSGWRLEWAESKLPKLEIIDRHKIPSGSSVSAELRKMVDKGADCALDCVGGEYDKVGLAVGLKTEMTEQINEMIMSVKKFGRIGVIAEYTGYVNHFNIGAVMELGIRVIGNGQAPVLKYWEELLKQIQSGELDPTIMLSHRIDIEDIPKAYRILDAKERMMKVFVETKFSSPPAEGTPLLTLL